MNKITESHFVELMRINVDNEKLTDEQFRQMIRNTLPVIEKSKKSDLTFPKPMLY
jgi:hypothetical protein